MNDRAIAMMQASVFLSVVAMMFFRSDSELYVELISFVKDAQESCFASGHVSILHFGNGNNCTRRTNGF